MEFLDRLLKNRNDFEFKMSEFTEEELEYACTRLEQMILGSELMLARASAKQLLEMLKKQDKINGKDKFDVQYEDSFVGLDIISWIGDYRRRHDTKH